MVDLKFLILNLWNSARLCLAAEYILIGVCSQPRILSPPFSTGFHFLFFHDRRFRLLAYRVAACEKTKPPSNHLVALRASYLARPWRAGFKQYYYHAGAWLNHFAAQSGEGGLGEFAVDGFWVAFGGLGHEFFGADGIIQGEFTEAGGAVDEHGAVLRVADLF